MVKGGERWQDRGRNTHVILVDLLHHPLNLLLAQLHLLASLLQLVHRDGSAAIRVKVLEGLQEVLLLLYLAQVERGRQELAVLYLTAAVKVGLGKGQGGRNGEGGWVRGRRQGER